ncbi:exported protein of unknown function [Nitrosotalea devaniterrae]|uniref:Uncharacterized protein n=1 Tax=Nitrosotalea devaniterrae TaxID=1078905 RepID=A0A128A238_9ARCH|nr:exported protein of unknown function [Candidatus Nitrosotalea devanaterra]
MKTLHYSIIAILFVFVLANVEHVFADNDSTSHLNVTTDYGGRGIMVNSNQTMSPFLPSPPLGMYPYTSKIFSVFQIDPEIVHPNDTSAIHILVTNNANFTLYAVNLGESVNDSKSMMFSNIHKIDILNPNQTKTIFGTLHVSSDVRPTDYYDVWWNVVAKNQTGNMMQSMQFHRNLPIAQNLLQYCCDKPVTIALKSPLKQFHSGVAAKDVKCNNGLQLIFKIVDNSPACVKQQTAQILVKYGWGTSLPAAIEQNILALSNSITIPNTNFSINYDITGNGKILDAKMDAQSKSLILSLETTSNGTLTVSLPRALLDIKKNDRGMGQFYMLADGRETSFKEIHTTPTDRIFSIPFQNGTKNIEIIATELI